MTEKEFLECLKQRAETLAKIRAAAHAIHASVNQTYDKKHPYGYHLDMVADGVRRFGHDVCANERDVLPLMFGAYYHDSIEDARLTYNDVRKEALQYMDESQALMAAEIVYALTNDKGRNRAERAGENYYKGIRETPYAPLVKLADRLANMTYSFTHSNEANAHMKSVYREELPHFLKAIQAEGNDLSRSLPPDMLRTIKEL